MTNLLFLAKTFPWRWLRESQGFFGSCFLQRRPHLRAQLLPPLVSIGKHMCDTWGPPCPAEDPYFPPPSFGNQAVRMMNLTRGFASPPRGGFALLGKESLPDHLYQRALLEAVPHHPQRKAFE